MALNRPSCHAGADPQAAATRVGHETEAPPTSVRAVPGKAAAMMAVDGTTAALTPRAAVALVAVGVGAFKGLMGAGQVPSHDVSPC
jgi:hypothetical protein